MPFSPDTLASFDDICSRLAGESILARLGSDEGLVPAYSLTNELLTLVIEANDPTLVAPLEARLQAVQAVLGSRLDAGLPFDEAALGELRNLVAWLPEALLHNPKDPAVPHSEAEGASETENTLVEVEEVSDSIANRTSDLHNLAIVDRVLELNLEENRELLAEFHAEALDHLMQIEAALLTLDSVPDDRDALNSLFRSFHTIKGVSSFLHLTPIQTLTHEVESLLDLVRTDRLRLTPEMVTQILASRDAVQSMINQITVALEQGRLPSEAVRVSHLIEAVRRLAEGGTGAIEYAAGNGDGVPAGKSEEREPARADNSEAKGAVTPEAVRSVPSSTPVASSVRVNTEKLDSLMDVVGELVIVQSQLQESARGAAGVDCPPLMRNLAQLGRITKDLQHTAMALRMVPIKPMFQRIGRVVRDLSRECGKQVRFATSGEDTEIDRTVVEEIVDPLVHMVRNAVDHGLEPAEARVAAGKDAEGKISLGAAHEGSSLVIELRDDGRGLDLEKILAKARRQGLVAEDAKLAPEEITSLIFLPGFSTAEKVTSISGRGVGMDVVRRNIERLGGHVQIESVAGFGSTFRIRLPLTTAIIDGLLVRVGPDQFILPSTSVRMALRPERASLASVQGRREALDHRGKILPLHRLHQRFGIDEAVTDPTAGIVVIVECGDRTYALLVDELVNKQEVVVKNLGGFLQNLPGVAGGAILGDGNIALILDPASLCAA